MTNLHSPARRRLLQRLALAVPLAALASVRARNAGAAESAPLIDASSPAARAVKYVEDAAHAPGVTAGNRCANCALYQGAENSAQGPCQIFPGKDVKAAGWCSSWAPQM